MSATASLLLATYLLLAQEGPADSDAFDSADSDASESLTFDEVRAVYPEISRATFDAIDADRDGTLSLTEFETAVEEGYLLAR